MGRGQTAARRQPQPKKGDADQRAKSMELLAELLKDGGDDAKPATQLLEQARGSSFTHRSFECLVLQ
jgi:hypothetical protein